MSRLYAWIESDTRKTTLTTRANQQLKIRINFGSKYDSKKMLIVNVHYPKETEKPIVEILSYIPIELRNIK